MGPIEPGIPGKPGGPGSPLSPLISTAGPGNPRSPKMNYIKLKLNVNKYILTHSKSDNILLPLSPMAPFNPFGPINPRKIYQIINIFTCNCIVYLYVIISIFLINIVDP